MSRPAALPSCKLLMGRRIVLIVARRIAGVEGEPE